MNHIWLVANTLYYICIFLVRMICTIDNFFLFSATRKFKIYYACMHVLFIFKDPSWDVSNYDKFSSIAGNLGIRYFGFIRFFWSSPSERLWGTYLRMSLVFGTESDIPLYVPVPVLPCRCSQQHQRGHLPPTQNPRPQRLPRRRQQYNLTTSGSGHDCSN